MIASIAKRYKVRRILLFGSNIHVSSGKSVDIDLAVEGIAAKNFFKFYGDLLFSLNKPVDLIDLTKNSPFTRFVQRQGILIYG